jgi:hypothetical protein
MAVFQNTWRKRHPLHVGRQEQESALSEIDRVGEEMCRHIFEFLLPLQTTKELNEERFELIDQSSRLFAKLLKGSAFIPRTHFKELYSAARTLEAEAPYARDPAAVNGMANKLHMTADLIVWGECHEDRVPGKPRIK